MKAIAKFFFLILNVHAITAFGGEYYFKSYTVKEGLPQSQVFSILQASSGYLWIGTGGGLASFDGHRFLSYSALQGLSNESIRCLFEDKKGNIWIGTYGGGLIKFDGRNFTEIKNQENLSNIVVRVVYEDSKGNIFYGTDGYGLFKISGNEGVRVPVSDNNKELRVWSILENQQGELLVGTIGNGLYIKRKENIEKFESNLFREIRIIKRFKNGNIYAGTDQGLFSIQNNIIEPVIIQGEANPGLITGIVEDTDNKYWIAGSKIGLCLLANNKVYFPNLPADIETSSIINLEMDREGHLWIGTNGKGLIKAEEIMFNWHNRQSGLSNPNIWTIIQDDSKRKYFGTNGAGVYYQDGKEIKPINQSDGLINGRIWCSAKDQEGALWFGTDLGIAIIKNTRVIKNITTKDGLPGNAILSILHEPDGGSWIGTFGNGAIHLKNGKRQIYSVGNGLANNNVWAIFRDSKNALWFCTDGGLSCLENDAIKNYSTRDGLSNNIVLSITEDKSGIIWLATYGGGINALSREGGKVNFSVIRSRDGLSHDQVLSLIIDSGFLWAGTYKGLNRLTLQDYHHSKEINIKVFGVNQGFLGLECNLNSVFCDSQNDLWFGTTDGVMQFNPKSEMISNSTETKTYILKKKLDYTDSILEDNCVLNYNQNNLAFEFIGISFGNSDNVKYTYRLDGFDNTWSEPSATNRAFYSNLPHGKYIFRVKSSNEQGLWNKNSSDFSFTVEPPFWKTWWFIFIEIGVCAGSIISFYYYRTRRLRYQKRFLEKRVLERTKELEIKNHEIESQKLILFEKNKEITDSIIYAKRIQEAILKEEEHVSMHLPPHFILFRPRDIVSGDFYWGFEKMNHLYLAAADCTGHGVPGAFMSMLGISFLNEIMQTDELLSPAQVLDQLRSKILKEFGKSGRKSKSEIDGNFGSIIKDGMDVALIRIGLKPVSESNQSFYNLEFAGANNPLWIYKSKSKEGSSFSSENPEFLIVKPDKQPVGYYPNPFPFVNQKLRLESSDTIYIFTDGYADQFGGPKGKKFKYSQLKEYLHQIQGEDLEIQKALLNSKFDEWRSGYSSGKNVIEMEQVDDVCVIGLRLP